jgi:Aldo/keto reductase family
MATSLPVTRLGRTDMLLTRVGLGAWAIGRGGWAFAWGSQDDSESIAAIRHAVESGVNWIDTAAVYGLGHSEEVVAVALAGIPQADRPYVFTRGALVWDPADRTTAPRRVGDPARLRADVEASLRRLNVERIDLYQMHWPAEDGTKVEEYWQAFLDFKREGKLRAVGLSNHDTSQVEAAEMASGLLTGAFTAERAARLEPGDWRAGDLDFTGRALSANLALAGAIVEARRPGQVDGWLPAATLELNEDDLADIAAAVHASGAGTGPATGPGS